MPRLILAAVIGVTLGGMAAGASATVSGSPSDKAGQAPAASAQPQPTTIHVQAANQIVGRELRDPSGADAGVISSLVIDTHTGIVDFVLVGSSGSFNVGGGLIAVPWQGLQPPNGGGGPITTRISVNKMLQSPRIGPALINRLNRPEQRNRIYGYYGYGYPGYYRYGYGGGLGAVGGYGAPALYRPRVVGQAGENAGAIANQGLPNRPRQDSAKPDIAQQNGAQQKGAQQNGVQQNAQNGDENGSALVVTRDAVVSTLDRQDMTSANALQNAAVYGRNGENLGDIDEVMLDVDRGEVAYVLLSRGGFLGLNQRWYTLPVEALVPQPYRNGYRLTVDAKTLLREPTFYVDRQGLPTHVSASQLAQLYQQFGMQPYWDQDNRRSAPSPAVGDKQGQRPDGQAGASK